jgi:transposase
VLGGGLARRDQAWRDQVTTASLDPFRGFATALRTHLPGVVRVLDPFYVTRVAIGCVDDVRRRVQQDTTGHRGRTGDPLYGLRRVLRRRHDRLSPHAWRRLEAGLEAGDPDGEVALAWDIAQKVMTLYQLDNPAEQADRAATLIAALRSCPILELARLGRTLHAWRDELLAAFTHPDVSNGCLASRAGDLDRYTGGWTALLRSARQARVLRDWGPARGSDAHAGTPLTWQEA